MGQALAIVTPVGKNVELQGRKLKNVNDYKEAIMKLGAKTKNIFFFFFSRSVVYYTYFGE